MDASDCAELLALVAQSVEASGSRAVRVYGRQASTFSTRLRVFQAAITHSFTRSQRMEVPVEQLTRITCAQDTIEKNLAVFIEACESSLCVELWHWPDWDQFFVRSEMFSSTMSEVITLARLLSLSLPLSHVQDAWQDAVDVYVDWSTALREVRVACGTSHAVTDFLQHRAPPRPKIRTSMSSDILTLFEVDTGYAESSDDDNDEADDDYASDQEDELDMEQRKAREEEARKQKAMKYRGNFTSSVFMSTLKESPVLLKKVGAAYCRGGDGPDGVGHALLALAASSLNAKKSPFLLAPLAVCTSGVGVTEEDGSNEVMSLMTRRQREKDAAAGVHQSPQAHSFGFGALSSFGHDDKVWKDQPVPRTIGILYPVAPFGCLMNFLQSPAPGLLPKGSKDVSVPSRVKLSIMLDVCQGLEFLHEHGVVHGRLHTRNVVICDGFRAKLTDFGVSHLVNPACAMGDGLPGAKKGEGFNPRWRAPEDLLRAEYSAAFPEDDAEEKGQLGGSGVVLDSVTGGLSGLGNLLTSTASQVLLEQHSYALVTRQSDVYAFAMLMYSIVVDGNRPFYNLPWDEAVINAVKKGERPSFPSWIAEKDDFIGIIPRDNGDDDNHDITNNPSCLIEECWVADPIKRKPLLQVREKLEENLGSTLKVYGNVVIDNMEGKIEAIDKKVAALREEVDLAEVKIEKGRAACQKKEAEMEKLFKPVEKKAIAQQLEKAYPRLEEATAKNDALRAEIATLSAEKESLLGEKGANEQDLFVRKKLLEKRDLSNVVFAKEVFVKQFTEYTKPFVVKHLRSACSNDSPLSREVAEEFKESDEGLNEIDDEMWSIVCRGAVFGSASNYSPKISSLYGYDGLGEGAGGRLQSGGEGVGDATAKKKIVVDVTKYYDNKDFEGEVVFHEDLRGRLAKSRGKSRRDVYFDSSADRMHVFDEIEDLRENQFSSEGFSPLNRYEDIDKKRKKVRCAAHFLNTYDFLEHDNTERMFVDKLTPELQYLIAARGDVRDANGMYLKDISFDATFYEKQLIGETSVAVGSARSTPVHLAASLGHLYSLKYLVDVHGAAADPVDSHDWSPFTVACYMGQLPVVRYLSERHRANMERVDADGLTPIHIVAMRGHLPILKYLLFRLRHKGDEFYFADQDLGGTLLHWACITTVNSAVDRSFNTVVKRHIDLVLYLLGEEDMHVNIRSRVDQSTPLMWACGAKPHSLTKHTLIDTLVENGADLTAVDQNGHCCLFYAASSGDLLIVKTLVEEFNVDISRTNAKGKTPAEMAVGKCASYLHHCLKNPPKKNRDFVPERYLKKDPVAKRLKEPRSIGTYLMKKSPSLLKGWQKRYFVMKEGYLRYYGTKAEYDGGLEAKGSINLLLLPQDDPEKSVTIAGAQMNEIHLLSKPEESSRKVSGKAKDKKLVKERVFKLQAPDHETAQAWVDVVKEWILFLHQ